MYMSIHQVMMPVDVNIDTLLESTCDHHQHLPGQSLLPETNKRNLIAITPKIALMPDTVTDAHNPAATI
jgi:hypothetical protein